MSAMFDNPNKTYIKSNAGTIMHLLWFVCGLLLLLVFGLCTFVIFGRDDTSNYHLDNNGQFYFQLSDNQATLIKFIDNDAEEFEIPASVNYGGKQYAVTTIANHAFSNHRQLTRVTIPDSVTEIMGDNENQTGAFSGCTALENVQLGHNVTRIGAYAFKNCLLLNAIDFPNTVQFIDDGALMGCLSLQSITLRSNGILGNQCFDDCINVETLVISNDVSLSDNSKRQVLAALPKLSNFVAENNHTYSVVEHCLVTTTNSENDTIVLGGYGAKVPSSTQQISDWAWGKRSSGTIYIPSTVVTIGTNSFNKGLSIYTDATSKPSTWLTNVPVYTQASLITFDADIEGVEPVTGYVYRDGDITFGTEFEDLFTGIKPARPFKKWNVSGSVYTAEYQDDTMANGVDLTNLTDELDIATVYLNDEDERLKFKLDFWENFKSVYYQAVQLNAQSYQYEVRMLTTRLHDLNQQINRHDVEILESEDWVVGLGNLVQAIGDLSVDDLAASVTADQLSELYCDTNTQGQVSKITTAKTFLANQVDDETARKLWKELRKLYEEKLQIDCGENSLLQKEINACEKLNRANYKAESWQNMQKQLKAANEIVEHGLVHALNVSAIRQGLISARNDLREVTLPDTFTKLNTWVSICGDLPKSDYEAAEYERLQLEVVTVCNRITDTDNNQTVNAAIADLQNRYHNLVVSDLTAKYQTSVGILNKKSVPFFVLAVLLFTGAVAAGAKAAALKKQLRQTQE